jgi:hypothetical protein
LFDEIEDTLDLSLSIKLFMASELYPFCDRDLIFDAGTLLEGTFLS